MKNIERNIVILLFLVCWIYLIVRAITVPFSHDEVATFFHFVHIGKFIDLPSNDLGANNHLLNTLLTIVSYNFFGSSELALRLPNLLIAPLYFFYHYLISKKLQSSILKWVYIVGVFFTHYIVEHLGYSRGYGMSLAFFAGAIYFTLDYVSTTNSKSLLKLSIMLFFALAANLALLHSFIIIFIYIIYIGSSRIKTMDKLKIIKQLFIYVIMMCTFLITVIYLLELKEKGALYMGGQEGFWSITMVTLIESINFSYNRAIAGFIIVLFILSIAAFVIANFKNISLKQISNYNNFYSYLLLGNIAAIILSNKLMGVNYPMNRGVMFLIPFFIGSFCFAINGIASSNKLKKVFILISLLILFIPVRSFGFINLSYQTYIGFLKQRIPARYIEKIRADGEKNNYKPLVSGDYMRHFVYDYYNYRNGGELNHFYRYNYPGKTANFQIVDTTISNDFTSDYDIIDFDEITSYALVKRKKPTIKKELFETSFNSSKGMISQEYFNFFKAENISDSLKKKAILLKFNFKFKTKKTTIPARLVIDLSDKNGKNLFYDYFPLDWTKTSWNNSTFNYSMHIHNIPKEAKSMVVYLWNINKEQMEISEGTIKFEEIILEK